MNKEMLGEGLMAEIYSWEAGKVLKLFRPLFPDVYVQHEAQIMAAAHAAGLPVPAMHEVVEQDGRFGIIMERLEKRSLLETWLADPSTTNTERVGQQLATLHTALHTCTLPDLEKLPSQREWLTNNIQDAPTLSQDTKSQTIAILQTLPDGKQLCHGDFHPGNILFTAHQQPVVIDWFSAVRGHPLADVARTVLLITQTVLPPTVPVTAAQRQGLAETYLNDYTQKNGVDHQTLQPWYMVTLAASFSEDFFQAPEQLHAQLQDWLAPHRSSS